MDIKEVKNWFDLIKWIGYKVLEKPKAEHDTWETIEVIDTIINNNVGITTGHAKTYILRNQRGEIRHYIAEF